MPKRRTLALYPGAFKPPHVSHLNAIRYLIEEIGVDTVAVIIANRSRLIPGTASAIDAKAAETLFAYLLEKSQFPIAQIDIEIAPHRAISHALSRLETADPDTEYLFCVGEEDYLSDDDRFSDIDALAEKFGVFARIEVLPRCRINVRASQLRETIGSSSVLETCGTRYLPDDMSTEDSSEYLSLCRRMARPVHEIAKSKILNALSLRYNLHPENLQAVDTTAVDPVFEFRIAAGSHFTVKYAGDNTGKGEFGVDGKQMPARRLLVERRVTRHLVRHLSSAVFNSRVDFLDHETRVLVVTGRQAGAYNVASELQENKFDPKLARWSASSLAALHNCPLPETPFWGSLAAEESHWRDIVDGLGSRAARAVCGELKKRLESSLSSSFAYAYRQVIVHLNCSAEALYCGDHTVAIENFETAGCYGDPAYDVASLVSDYLIAGITHDSLADSLGVVDCLMDSYRSKVSHSDERFSMRVLTYSACHILCRSLDSRHDGTDRALIATASELLATCAFH